MTDWPLFVVECFVALGTLGLAWFTMRLARSTKLDVEAQWRPLLVPRQLQDATQLVSMRGATIWAEVAGANLFRFCFENVGKGAALDVHGIVAERQFPGIRIYRESDALSSPVIAANGHAFFQRTVKWLDKNRIDVIVEYADLAGNPHRTEATYQREGENAPWAVTSVNPRPPHVRSAWEYAVLGTRSKLRHPSQAVKKWWLRNPPY